MVYLYASLVVMMLTGIMAMFEMAMLFNAQQIRFVLRRIYSVPRPSRLIAIYASASG